ncbi:broad substrate specificity ATP-binding cassette transporter ABCG2-like [Callospermophilus lateralis]
MAMILGAGEKTMEIKTFLVTVYFVFMMVILGMTLNFGTTTPWLSWIEYLSIPHYGYMALQHNEFLGQNFCPGLSTTESSGCISYVICTGEEFLTLQGIDLSPWGLWNKLLNQIREFREIIIIIINIIIKAPIHKICKNNFQLEWSAQVKEPELPWVFSMHSGDLEV